MRRNLGRAALLVTAGLLLFAVNGQHAMAATAGDDVTAEQGADAKPLSLIKTVSTKRKQPRVHHASRSRKPAKVAAKERSRPSAKVASTSAPKADLPETVANANARMPTADARGEAAAIDITPPPLEAAAADQLTELDKSLTATPVEEPQQIAQLAETAAPSATTPPPEPPRPVTQARATASTDAWAQSSLIGKIFIAFGGMLTLASAARMLIA